MFNPEYPRYSPEDTGEASYAIKGSSFEDYCEILKLNPQEMRGKTILDLGSGDYENFSNGARKFDAKVYSVNPKLKEWWPRMKTKRFVPLLSGWEGKSTAAIAQELPFQDMSFDMVVSLYGIPSVLRSSQSTQKSIEELVRITKPSGEIRLGPLHHWKYSGNQEKDIYLLKRYLGDNTIKTLRGKGWIAEIDHDKELQKTSPRSLRRSILVIKQKSRDLQNIDLAQTNVTHKSLPQNIQTSSDQQNNK